MADDLHRTRHNDFDRKALIFGKRPIDFGEIDEERLSLKFLELVSAKPCLGTADLQSCGQHALQPIGFFRDRSQRLQRFGIMRCRDRPLHGCLQARDWRLQIMRQRVGHQPQLAD